MAVSLYCCAIRGGSICTVSALHQHPKAQVPLEHHLHRRRTVRGQTVWFLLLKITAANVLYSNGIGARESYIRIYVYVKARCKPGRPA